MTKKFDTGFEEWLKENNVLDIPEINSNKWAHALAYTGGINILDKPDEYTKKLGWMISGSPIMTSKMRHEMYMVAEHIGVPVKYKGYPIKLVKPRTFKALGIEIIRNLREMYDMYG